MKKTLHPSLLFFCVVIAAFFLSSCKTDSVTTDPVSNNPNNPNPGISPIPKSPGTIIVPVNNPMTAQKIDLGRHLFFEKAMSVDNSTACSSCHDPAAGFSDSHGLPTSTGFARRIGTRNAPALANIGYRSVITWDGKFKTLEDHAVAPMFNTIEMGNDFSSTGLDTITTGYYHTTVGNNDTNFLFKRLNNRGTDINGKSYSDLFIAAYGDSKITMDRIVKSIASFERTFISTGSTFDKYNNGDQTAYKYNPRALRGFQLFTDANGANCVSCHNGYDFTDQQFHNNGLGVGVTNDSGRSGITHNPADAYKFRTPSLRNVALSGPYMHDGRFKTLDDVLNFYNRGGNPNVANKDVRIKPMNLSDEDIADIIEFLKTLSDNDFIAEQSTRFANPWPN